MLPLSLQRALAYRPSVVGTGSSAQRVLSALVGSIHGRHWVLGSWKGPDGSGSSAQRVLLELVSQSKVVSGSSALGPRHKGSCRHWLGPSTVGTGSSAHGRVLSALGVWRRGSW